MQTLHKFVGALSVLAREAGLHLLDIDDSDLSVKDKIKIVDALTRCNDSINVVISVMRSAHDETNTQQRTQLQ
nr:MAG TPA: hypothetical protein [Caudoviricetes sp.]